MYSFSLKQAMIAAAATLSTVVSSQQTTVITGCNFHGTAQYCVDAAGREGIIEPAPTETVNAIEYYTGCNNHGSEFYCLYPTGGKVAFSVEADVTSTAGESSIDTSSSGRVTTLMVTQPSSTNNLVIVNLQTSMSQFSISSYTPDVSSSSYSVYSTTYSQSTSTATTQTETEAVTLCHFQGTFQLCVADNSAGGTIIPAPTSIDTVPAQHARCHDGDTYCSDEV